MVKRRAFILTLCLTLMSCFTSFADTSETQSETEAIVESDSDENVVPDIERNYDLTDALGQDTDVPLKIKLNVPDGFEDDITVYLNGIPRYFNHQEGKENNGYSSETAIQPGIYKIDALDESDVMNRYSFTKPDSYDTSSDKPLTITVKDNMPDMVEDDDPAHDYVEGTEAPTETHEAATADLSGGSEYGTLHIKMVPCEALQSVEITFKGDDGKKYPVTLVKEHNYESYVKLPVGTYTEQQGTNVILINGRTIPDGMTFNLAHHDDIKAFGKNYVVSTNTESKFTDLTLIVNYKGASQEITTAFMDSFEIKRLSESMEASRYADINKTDVSESKMNNATDAASESVVETEETVEQDDGDEQNEDEEIASAKRKDFIRKIILVAVAAAGACGAMYFATKKKN